MKTFEENIHSIYGEQGKIWLQNLPLLLENIQDDWDIGLIKPFPHMSFNYVVEAENNEGSSYVLKVFPSKKAYFQEHLALQFFKGSHMVRVLRNSPKFNALLLEKLTPGTSLKERLFLEEDTAVEVYGTILKSLWNNPSRPIEGQFPSISDWFKVFEGPQSTLLPREILKRAQELRGKLEEQTKEFRLFHGDLHLDNILMHGKKWMVIDPKGALGTKAFEASAFDFILDSELEAGRDLSKILQRRLKKLAQHINLCPKELKEALFLKLTLSTLWFMEDRLSPEKPLKILEILMKMKV